MKKDNIPGLEGYYISRLGTLWSRYHKSGKLTHSEWHKVKPNHNQKGYLFVQKKGKCGYLHRLVALAWIPNPNAKLSKAQRREIKFRYESREKICRLANEFKVSRLTIRRIVNPSLRSFNRLV